MTTSIKITALTDIGANIAYGTIVPVVNMAGTPTTEKANLQIIGNMFLAGAGGANFVAAATAITAGTVTTAAQPNITGVGTLGNLGVSGNIAAGNVSATMFTGALTGAATTAGTVTTAAQPNITGVGTLGSLTVNGLTNLGAIGNITITGGTVGQVLSTDGNGVLSWASDANSSYGNTQVAAYLPTYTGNLAGGNANLGNLVIANFFQGDLYGVANSAVVASTANAVAGANVSGEVATANYATFSGTAASSNAVAGANVSGEVANATYATTSGTSYSVAGANVSGEVANATYATTSGTSYSVAGANVSGEVANATYALTSNSSNTAGTVTTAAQPNITSVGNLTSLRVISGNITLGLASGLTSQGANAISIGEHAGTLNQGVDALAFGTGAGANGQGTSAFAVGRNAGNILQGADGVAIGRAAGGNAQGAMAVAIGLAAGHDRQGANSIAIGSGAGANSQAVNSIILNATDSELNQTVANTFTVMPVRHANTANVMYYNSASGEISYDVIGTVANATYAVSAGSATTAGTVTTNAQGNITSVGTLSALAVTGNVSSGNFILDNTGILAFGLGSHLSFGDVPVTNRFYVDPTRTDTAQYTANGSQAKPFATISAALAVANASTFAPNYIILMGSITEDVTLTKGHVFLVGATSSIAAPIVLSGTVTVQGGAGTIDANHFAIQGLMISDGGASNCITFTGTNPQRLFLTDVWLQCGTGATGAGIYADNTGSGSIINGKGIKVSHGGTGDRYCFNIQHGTASFWSVETSGAVQVGSVHAGAVLTFNDSELDANGDTVLETYDTGMLVVTNSLITNLAADSFGVKLNGSGGTVAIAQTAINVPLSATGQAVWLDPLSIGGILSFGGMSFYPGKNTTISPTLTMVPIVSMAGTLAYPIFAGNITANALPQTWSMYDNYTAALSFDTAGKTGILKLVTTNNAEGISSSGYVKTVATTIGALPAAATAGAGARSFVTDCDLVSAGNFGAVAAHTSGANATPVFSDGTDWRIG